MREASFGRPSLWHTDEVFDSVTMKLAVLKLIVVVALGLCATPAVTRAQQADKVYRVGYLRFGSPGGDPFQPVFEQALRERGWVNGGEPCHYEPLRRGTLRSAPCPCG
jgi:hypothetical protein